MWTWTPTWPTKPPRKAAAKPGENVIAAIGAQITELKAQIAILGAKIDSQGAEIRSEIKAQTARIDILQRVIWPLIGLLATTVFGLLYRVVTG